MGGPDSINNPSAFSTALIINDPALGRGVTLISEGCRTTDTVSNHFFTFAGTKPLNHSGRSKTNTGVEVFPGSEYKFEVVNSAMLRSNLGIFYCSRSRDAAD